MIEHCNAWKSLKNKWDKPVGTTCRLAGRVRVVYLPGDRKLFSLAGSSVILMIPFGDLPGQYLLSGPSLIRSRCGNYDVIHMNRQNWFCHDEECRTHRYDAEDVLQICPVRAWPPPHFHNIWLAFWTVQIFVIEWLIVHRDGPNQPIKKITQRIRKHKEEVHYIYGIPRGS